MERAINLPGYAQPATISGTAYVQTVLNPCGETQPVELAGIPDGGNTDIVVLAMRDDMNWPAPSFGAGSWSTIVFDTPYLVAQQIIVRYNDSDGEPSSPVLRGYINGTAADDMPFYPDWLRPNVQAVEDLTNPNHPTITTTFFPANFEFTVLRPSVLTNFSFSPVAIGWRQLRKFRCIAKGRTMHLNAPATGTQSRVNSAHVGTESSPKILMQDQDPLADDIQTPYPARFTVTPPYSFQVLPQQDLNCRQDIFKTGAYDIQRHWSGSVSWNELEDVRPIWRADPNNLAAVWRIPITVPNQTNTLPLNTQNIMKYDGFDVNLGWVVTHISGLARSTTDSNNVTVHMKHRSYWEFNVPGDSPWAANKRAPCPMDDGSLACERYLGPLIPHSYEAKYNDWGLLGSAISSILPGVGRILGNLLGGANRSNGNSQPPRENVIADPYGGRNLYGQGGFVSPSVRPTPGININLSGGNGSGRRRRRNRR